MTLRHFVAFYDFVAVDRADARNHLFIFDALARRLVHLMELDLRATLRSRVKLNGDRHESDPDLSPPDGPRCHGPDLLFSPRFNHCGDDSFRGRGLTVRSRMGI